MPGSSNCKPFPIPLPPGGKAGLNLQGDVGIFIEGTLPHTYGS